MTEQKRLSGYSPQNHQTEQRSMAFYKNSYFREATAHFQCLQKITDLKKRSYQLRINNHGFSELT